MDGILKLLKSKNPIIVAVGITGAIAAISWAGFNAINTANNYMSQFETKASHSEDIEERVSSFRKDVKIALLENNKALLDEIEKRMRH